MYWVDIQSMGNTNFGSNKRSFFFKEFSYIKEYNNYSRIRLSNLSEVSDFSGRESKMQKNGSDFKFVDNRNILYPHTLGLTTGLSISIELWHKQNKVVHKGQSNEKSNEGSEENKNDKPLINSRLLGFIGRIDSVEYIGGNEKDGCSYTLVIVNETANPIPTTNKTFKTKNDGIKLGTTVLKDLSKGLSPNIGKNDDSTEIFGADDDMSDSLNYTIASSIMINDDSVNSIMKVLRNDSSAMYDIVQNKGDNNNENQKNDQNNNEEKFNHVLELKRIGYHDKIRYYNFKREGVAYTRLTNFRKISRDLKARNAIISLNPYIYYKDKRSKKDEDAESPFGVVLSLDNTNDKSNSDKDTPPKNLYNSFDYYDHNDFSKRLIDNEKNNIIFERDDYEIEFSQNPVVQVFSPSQAERERAKKIKETIEEFLYKPQSLSKEYYDGLGLAGVGCGACISRVPVNGSISCPAYVKKSNGIVDAHTDDELRTNVYDLGPLYDVDIDTHKFDWPYGDHDKFRNSEMARPLKGQKLNDIIRSTAVRDASNANTYFWCDLVTHIVYKTIEPLVIDVLKKNSNGEIKLFDAMSKVLRRGVLVSSGWDCKKVCEYGPTKMRDWNRNNTTKRSFLPAHNYWSPFTQSGQPSCIFCNGIESEQRCGIRNNSSACAIFTSKQSITEESGKYQGMYAVYKQYHPGSMQFYAYYCLMNQAAFVCKTRKYYTKSGTLHIPTNATNITGPVNAKDSTLIAISDTRDTYSISKNKVTGQVSYGAIENRGQERELMTKMVIRDIIFNDAAPIYLIMRPELNAFINPQDFSIFNLKNLFAKNTWKETFKGIPKSSAFEGHIIEWLKSYDLAYGESTQKKTLNDYKISLRFEGPREVELKINGCENFTDIFPFKNVRGDDQHDEAEGQVNHQYAILYGAPEAEFKDRQGKIKYKNLYIKDRNGGHKDVSAKLDLDYNTMLDFNKNNPFGYYGGGHTKAEAGKTRVFNDEEVYKMNMYKDGGFGDEFRVAMINHLLSEKGMGLSEFLNSSSTDPWLQDVYNNYISNSSQPMQVGTKRDFKNNSGIKLSDDFFYLEKELLTNKTINKIINKIGTAPPIYKFTPEKINWLKQYTPRYVHEKLVPSAFNRVLATVVNKATEAIIDKDAYDNILEIRSREDQAAEDQLITKINIDHFLDVNPLDYVNLTGFKNQNADEILDRNMIVKRVETTFRDGAKVRADNEQEIKGIGSTPGYVDGQMTDYYADFSSMNVKLTLAKGDKGNADQGWILGNEFSESGYAEGDLKAPSAGQVKEIRQKEKVAGSKKASSPAGSPASSPASLQQPDVVLPTKNIVTYDNSEWESKYTDHKQLNARQAMANQNRFIKDDEIKSQQKAAAELEKLRKENDRNREKMQKLEQKQKNYSSLGKMRNYQVPQMNKRNKKK